MAGAILPTGTITTYAGGPLAQGSPLNLGLEPAALALNGTGHVLIADVANDIVWLANLTNSATTQYAHTVGSNIMAEITRHYSWGTSTSPGPTGALNPHAGMAVDSAGNLYLADPVGNRVWEIQARTGVMTAVAGTGTPGYSGDGSAATTAELDFPQGVVVDRKGNLLIADSLNNRIREVVAATGVITTIAGNGTQGYSGDGGPAIAAELNLPRDLAVDGTGGLYIADQGNNRIREMLAGTLVITTVAGTGTPGYGGDGGPAIAAELNGPGGVTLDGMGDIFIADMFNNCVREVLAHPEGVGNRDRNVIITVAGDGIQGYSGDGDPATKAELNRPSSVVVDGAGNIFIADQNNNRVREVPANSGVINTVAGDGTPSYGGDRGPATDAQLSFPKGIVPGPGNNLFIADQDNNRVRVVIASTGVISMSAGNGIAGFSGDGGLAVNAELNYPRDVADGPGANLFIVDQNNNRIREVLASTRVIMTVAGNGTRGYSGDGGPATKAELNFPKGLIVDGAGNIFIGDTYNNRVREVLASTGIITTVAGNGKAGYSGDGGPATAAKLDSPRGLALDSKGDLFIDDLNNNCIREVLAGTGVITTVAGIGTGGFSGDGGPATQARLNRPDGIAVDSAGNIFIADLKNQRVREVLASTGVITTVAGNGVAGPGGDGGPATAASLDMPHGLALDGKGDLFISDTANQRIREVRLTYP